MAALTLAHVIISLVGIGSGFIVMFGLLTARRMDRWTAVFPCDHAGDERIRVFASGA